MTQPGPLEPATSGSATAVQRRTGLRVFGSTAFSLTVFCLTVFGLTASSLSAQSAGTVYLSTDTAFGPRTGSGNCSSSLTRETPARVLADGLDDPWFAASGQDAVSLGIFPSSDLGPINDNYVLAFPGTAISVEIGKYDISSADAVSTAANSFGVIDVPGGTDPQLVTGSSEQLQDCAPKPTSLVSTAEGGPLAAPSPSWSAVGFSGDRNTLDSVLFSFSEPVGHFGAWFGDLETRVDDATTAAGDGGEVGYVKLYRADGTVLSVEPIVPAEQEPVTADGIAPGNPGFDNEGFGCGARDVGPEPSSCGNHGTRFIGFNWATAEVAYMQVIVGDDDHCSITSGCDGLTESLSFIGPQLALNDPTVTLTKVVNNDNFGQLGAGDFVLQVAEDPNGATTVTDHGDGDVVGLNAGVEYQIREPIIAGYSLAALQCVDDQSGTALAEVFTPTLGQSITCTLTNDDIASDAFITVIKSVINDDGGTLSAAEAELLVTVGGVETVHVSGDRVAFSNEDPVTISENVPDSYALIGVNCVDANQVAVAHPVIPNPALEITCTVTNDDIATTTSTVATTSTSSPTAVPTTAVPTTAVPTTAVPTTAVPTTAVPTTEGGVVATGVNPGSTTPQGVLSRTGNETTGLLWLALGLVSLGLAALTMASRFRPSN